MRYAPVVAMAGSVVLALALVPALSGGAHAQEAKAKTNVAAAAKSGPCKPHRGKGWAFTEGLAKFQAWEIVAQVSGNWPIPTDTFKNERYKCKPDGSGWTCYSWIDVCRSS